MSRNLLPLSVVATLLGGTAVADVPGVAVDIAPVHALVARVMDGVGTPDLIVQQGASPHSHSLRPSEAGAIESADLVVWMGADLTPWMADAIATLAQDAAVLTLLEADGTTLLDFREGALFEAHTHGDDHGDHDHDHDGDHDHGHGEEHAHDGHDHDHDHGDDHAHDHDHDHAEDHSHEHDHDHDHAHDDHAGHSHGAHDPHAWLSPANAASWLNLIAAELSAADPDNAGTYFANAAAGRAELEALSAEVAGILEPVRGLDFIVFHDAYQYFETAFDLPAAGAISLSDASDPSPARIAEIQARVRDAGIDCVLSEPQFNPGLVATVLDGTDASTAVIDPLGVDLELGPSLYPTLIRSMATALAACG